MNKWFISVLFCLVATIQVSAQSTITGTVTSDLGEYLPGVNVLIKGSNEGTITDANGKYKIQVLNSNSTLIFSFIGFATEVIPVNNQVVINVQLTPDITTLKEIVVVGFGTQNRVNLTGSVATLDKTQLVNRGLTNISNLLAGQAAGVTVLQRGGNPGRNEGTIRIRGIGTLGDDAKNNPLIIVDGIETGSLLEVDPNDVANISILKDAAAASIYGVRAANGVILVTTKRGSQGRSIITFNSQVGISTPIMLPTKTNAFELATLHNEANKNAGSPTIFKFADLDKFKNGTDPILHPDADRLSRILNQPAVRTSHNLSLSGGNSQTLYNLSFGYTKEKGVMINTNLDRYTFRSNIDQKITDKLKAGINMAGSVRQVVDPIDGVGGILHRAYREWNTDPIQYGDGRWAYPTYSGLDHNAVALLSDRGSSLANDVKLIGTVFAEYEFIKGLKLKGVAGNVRDFNTSTFIQRSVDLYNIDQLTGEINSTPNPSHPAVNSSIAKSNFMHSDINLQWLLNYEKVINNHMIKVLAGYNQRKETSEILSASRRNINPLLDQINGGSTKPQDASTAGNTIDYRLRSFFGRLNYSFMDKYLLEANLRYDGSSRFPASNRFQTFPSLSAGWKISEEQFLKNNSTISSLKLRASWGKLGNQEIGDYAFINKVDFNSTSAIIGGIQVAGATESFQLANQIIRWETTTTYNVGLDAELMESKFTFTIDYFKKVTNDVLLPVEQPRILGATPPLSNAGSVQNTGIELNIGYRNQMHKWKYSINANVTSLHNKVTSLGGESVKIVNGFRYEVGKPVTNIYGFVSEGLFINSADVGAHANQAALGGITKAGDIKYKDLNGDGVIDNNDRQDLGSYFPSINYGISANLSFKNLDLSMLWQGVAGVDAYVTGRLARPFLLSSAPLQIQYQDRAIINDAGELTNPNAKFPRTLFSNTNNYTGEVSDGRANSFFVKSTAFLKLRNLQVGYTLSESMLKRAGITKMRIYISGENLLTISPFNYYQVDPEIPSTGDPVPTYPTVKTYLIGMNLTF